MNSSAIANAEASILARVIVPNEPQMPPAVAAELLKWRFTDADQRQMSELAAKARQGDLTAEEQVELEGYERVSSFLGLVKSLARRSATSVTPP